MLAALTAFIITSAARLITGARALWLGCAPQPVQRLYFANHSSHGDFVLIWASLPAPLRRHTRPVAGADYWAKPGLRDFLIRKVFNGVLIDRHRVEGQGNPLQPIFDALAQGDSLIFFPEGTRNLGDEPLMPFKSGLFHLAAANPGMQLVPVWIANLNRVMPKGRALPLPLLCTLSFGEPIHLQADEGKQDFLERASQALLNLAPKDA
ncbi:MULTISPECIES: lysophospholipid acyltransferase family protein [Pseudomonas]|uniref:1-acyl-sn-glycerol-3-phosphate acyltransferase n=1 Tax=Pseudomonas taiwanensis TaxID=470150 RepID=A0ABR6VB12_9PSED|nr:MULTISPECIES: lysophospholipid acyltransferase family protein [Pseudomonas]MBC3477703.1 1-acyl-sn-glycerol-3-phosphate acyltransferase [Pseudomonas taiwanensis]MBC3493007.1 1-acyl-sn-glycerol-3-phosphate acyltransferase [Pseudomonas taiwanensis]MDT8925925.1 lysophospholipid acyltransferase family protein [Pseudomonas taiwanensis]MPT00772.1 1-acyl-sn-glycerol-3-phosphate acyltransferase [Pseudomonas sp.]WEZ89402.1 lysophospholipid acyltransferase family protein [Pseudomonas sp. NyZ480]